MQNELITGPDLAALLMSQPVDVEKITRKAWLKIERKNPSRYILRDAVQGYLRYLDHERTRGRSVKECSDHLIMSTRRFLQLVTEGVFERVPRGGYDLDAIRERFIKHQREQAAGREGEGNAMLAANRSRLAAAKADEAEFVAAVRRKDFVSVKEVTERLTRDLMIQRELLLSWSGSLPPILDGLSMQAMREKIHNEVYDILTLMAGPEVYAFGDDDTEKPVDYGVAVLEKKRKQREAEAAVAAKRPRRMHTQRGSFELPPET